MKRLITLIVSGILIIAFIFLVSYLEYIIPYKTWYKLGTIIITVLGLVATLYVFGYNLITYLDENDYI